MLTVNNKAVNWLKKDKESTTIVNGIRISHRNGKAYVLNKVTNKPIRVLSVVGNDIVLPTAIEPNSRFL